MKRLPLEITTRVFALILSDFFYCQGSHVNLKGILHISSTKKCGSFNIPIQTLPFTNETSLHENIKKRKKKKYV